MIRANDLIWVHDYHLMCLPAQLRARNLRNPIGFFLHIPFPSPDVLASVPEAAGLIRDLLHADLLGFQTDRDLENFVAAAETFADAVSSGDGWLLAAGRRVRSAFFRRRSRRSPLPRWPGWLRSPRRDGFGGAWTGKRSSSASTAWTRQRA